MDKMDMMDKNITPSNEINMLTDEQYMGIALEYAGKSYDMGEVPVGAIVVWDDGRIVGRGYNRRESSKNALSHAELEAIDSACKTLHGWRLHRATLYVTLEPCPMCAGAIVNARIKRVVYGASDAKAGAMGSVFDMGTYPLNHKYALTSGVRETECMELLRRFFSELRIKKSKKFLCNS